MSDTLQEKESSKLDEFLILSQGRPTDPTWRNFIEYVKQNCDMDDWYDIDGYSYKVLSDTVFELFGATTNHYTGYSIVRFPDSNTRLLFEMRFR